MSHATPTRRHATRALAIATALAMGTVGCSGGSDTIEVSAVFDDVRDLVPRNSIRAGDGLMVLQHLF